MGKKTEEFLNRGIGRGGAYTNPITTRICRSLDHTIPGRAPRLLLMKTARPFLKAHVKSSLGKTLLDGAYRLAFNSYRWAACRSNTLSHLDITLVDPSSLHNSATIDFFNSLDYGGKWHFNNHASKIAWKLSLSKKCRLYFISNKGSTAPFMYLIIQDRFTKTKFGERYSDFTMMTLKDFGMIEHSAQNYKHLLSVVEHLFSQSDSEILETVTTSPVLVSLARRRGHLNAGQGVTFYYKVPETFDLPPDGSKTETWHFTHFCADAFSFA